MNSLKVKVVNKKPWFWDILFFHDWESIDAFALGRTIYARKPLDDARLAHEVVHCRQQKGLWFVGLFNLFFRFRNKDFRLKTELEACRAEVAAGADKNDVAKTLSHPIYELDLTYEEALKLL